MLKISLNYLYSYILFYNFRLDEYDNGAICICPADDVFIYPCDNGFDMAYTIDE